MPTVYLNKKHYQARILTSIPYLDRRVYLIEYKKDDKYNHTKFSTLVLLDSLSKFDRDHEVLRVYEFALHTQKEMLKWVEYQVSKIESQYPFPYELDYTKYDSILREIKRHNIRQEKLATN